MSTVRTFTLSTALAFAAATLAGAAFAGDLGATDRAAAASLGCPVPIRVASIAIDFRPSDNLGELDPWTADDESDEAIRLSQQLRLQAAPSELPRRVPPRQTYYIQMEGQRTFNKFAAGAALPQLDCIEIECPSSFPSDTRCWRCVETIASPDGGGSDD